MQNQIRARHTHTRTSRDEIKEESTIEPHMASLHAVACNRRDADQVSDKQAMTAMSVTRTLDVLWHNFFANSPAKSYGKMRETADAREKEKGRPTSANLDGHRAFVASVEEQPGAYRGRLFVKDF